MPSFYPACWEGDLCNKASSASSVHGNHFLHCKSKIIRSSSSSNALLKQSEKLTAAIKPIYRMMRGHRNLGRKTTAGAVDVQTFGCTVPTYLIYASRMVVN